ncbi:MAG: DUF1844 domain-containing protein [Acidobacteriia bacterium]|nr:DUF1844 domain-containing protein [Terriglobia bacterium]
MAEREKDSGFKVSDRRLFTADGDLRTEAAEEEAPAPAVTQSVATNAVAEATPAPGSDIPAPPTASEQQEQHDAYKKSSRDLDVQVELGGHSAKELEVSFERFMASLYMTAMLQLGLMHEQGGQPGVDLIGARQTIDTLGMLADKTKGNLTSKEQAFLQNCLYELRMAYVEVTNALARPPQTPGPTSGVKG